MLFKRIIPCLDVTGGRVVKGVNFVGLRDAGDPAQIAARYNDQGADELTFLDITATSDGRDLLLHMIEAVIYNDIGRDGMLSGRNIEATLRLAEALSVPVIASGGLASMADIERLLDIEASGVEGVICGRAIYTGALDFASALQRVDAVERS